MLTIGIVETVAVAVYSSLVMGGHTVFVAIAHIAEMAVVMEYSLMRVELHTVAVIEVGSIGVVHWAVGDMVVVMEAKVVAESLSVPSINAYNPAYYRCSKRRTYASSVQ